MQVYIKASLWWCAILFSYVELIVHSTLNQRRFEIWSMHVGGEKKVI